MAVTPGLQHMLALPGMTMHHEGNTCAAQLRLVPRLRSSGRLSCLTQRTGA